MHPIRQVSRQRDIPSLVKDNDALGELAQSNIVCVSKYFPEEQACGINVYDNLTLRKFLR